MTQPAQPLPYDELLRRAHALWMIIDNIDSADDGAKEDDAAFRRMVMRRVGERHKLFASDDHDVLHPVPAQADIRDPAQSMPATITPRSAWALIAGAAQAGGMTVEVDGDEGSDLFRVTFRRHSYCSPEDETKLAAPQKARARELNQIEQLAAEMAGDQSLDCGPYLEGGESGYAFALRLLRQARAAGVFARGAIHTGGVPPQTFVVDGGELATLRHNTEILQRVSDLVHERMLRLRIRDKDAPPGLIDVIRGLINDACVDSVNLRDLADLRARAEAAERERHTAVEQVDKYKAAADTAVASMDKLRLSDPELFDLHVLVSREIAPLDPSLDRRTGESNIGWATRLLQAARDRGAFMINWKDRAEAAEARLAELAAADKEDHILRG